MHGMGKEKALEAAEIHTLKSLGNLYANIDDVYMESKRFIARCYGQKEKCSSKNREDCLYFSLVFISFINFSNISIRVNFRI